MIVAVAILTAGAYIAVHLYRQQLSAGPKGTLQAYVDGYNARDVDKVYGLFSSRAAWMLSGTVEYALKTKAEFGNIRITGWSAQEENVTENTAVLMAQITYSYSVPMLYSGSKTESVCLPMVLENGKWLIDNSKLIDLPWL